MARYIALADGKPGAYGVTVPDLPGCTSGGSTTDEALRNAVEAIRLWAEDAVADGEALPHLRSAEMLLGDPEIAAAIAEGAALAIVPLLRDAGRPAKANLSIDAGLLAAIDEAAEARGLTRSAFLATAAREKIESGGSSCLSVGSKARANGPAAGPVEGVTSTPDGRFPVSPTWKPREFWTDSVNARALLYSRA